MYYRFIYEGIILRVLGERLNGIQEVKSSILSVSTKIDKFRLKLVDFTFISSRNYLFYIFRQFVRLLDICVFLK